MTNSGFVLTLFQAAGGKDEMIEKIKELRARTFISLGKCKKALQESDGDVEKAIVWLQKQGELRQPKAKGEDIKNGQIYSYTHDNKIGVLVEVNCQTESAARHELFTSFCETVALQVAAMSPQYLASSDVPKEKDKKQREIFSAQVPSKIPENRVDHIINGKMKKWFGEVCLLEQKSVVESGKTIDQLRAALVMQLNEDIIVRRFVRWELG